jgi:hypothetical protein
MKKIVSLALAVSIAVNLCACGSGTSGSTSSEQSATSAEAKAEETSTAESSSQSETLSEDEQMQADMDELSAIGEVSVENGLLTVSLTVPADLAGEVTQESLDQGAGDTYISAKLNEDGSVTYKMTKSQHAKMLDAMVESMDNSIQELVDSDDYTFTSIKHNEDFTQFDITLSATEIGFAEAFSTIAFYMYGGIYGIFSGHKPENVIVNFYDASGNLIKSANSADMESESSSEK